MNDFYKMSSMMKELFPSNPEADKKALLSMASGQAQESAAATKDYLQESVEVPKGSMQLDRNYSVTDFAALAGVTETQKTGSAGQAKGSDAMPKMSTPSSTGEQPHPLKDKLVGEDDIDIKALTPGAMSLSGSMDIDDQAQLVARGLKKAAQGEVLSKMERDAIKPFVNLFSMLITRPQFRNNLIAMQKVLDKSKNKDKKEESIKERLYKELNKYK